MSAGEMGTAPLSLSSGDAVPTALSSSLAFTHQCTGARAAPSPSCSEGSWSLQGLCSARMPGSTLRAGRAMWTQAGRSCLYPVLELPPTSTHEMALVPRGLIVAVTTLGTERATVARAADAQTGATASTITIASPIATAGLLGPTGTGCMGRDQPAGSRGGRQQPGGPLQPYQHPTHPTVTHTGSPGRRCQVGSKASACPHTAIGKSQSAAVAWGGRDIAFSPLPTLCAPYHPPVPVPRLTHGTTTAPHAPHSAPAVGGRRSLRGHRHPPAPPADGSHCRDVSQCGI